MDSQAFTCQDVSHACRMTGDPAAVALASDVASVNKLTKLLLAYSTVALAPSGAGATKAVLSTGRYAASRYGSSLPVGSGQAQAAKGIAALLGRAGTYVGLASKATAALSPGRAGALALSVMTTAGTDAFGITTNSDVAKCLGAVAALVGNIAVIGIGGAATGGVLAVVRAAGVVASALDVMTSCDPVLQRALADVN